LQHPEQVDEFLTQCVYLSGAYDKPEGYTALRDRLDESEAARGGPAGRLFYLALPPDVFLSVAQQIKVI
jgi:glucose-6-phosphate 1-dehydrogenase